MAAITVARADGMTIGQLSKVTSVNIETRRAPKAAGGCTGA